MKSPLAHKNNTKLLQTFSTADLRQNWLEAFQIDPNPFFRGVERIEKYKCEDSGLLFYSPPDCAGSECLYRQLRKHEWYYMNEKWEFNQALKYLPKAGRLLEVGSGDSHFLKKAVSEDLALEGLELSIPEGTKASNSHWSVIDRNVQNHARMCPCKYDVVCSFQVLEHVVDPRSFLEACTELLVPNGLLILSTPNSNSFLRHAFNLLDMPPHHMSGWSKQSFRFLESFLPLTIKKMLFEPLADYHIDYFMNTYNSRFSREYDLRGAWTRGILGKWSKMFLQSGLRYWLKGQSMLTVLQKAQ